MNLKIAFLLACPLDGAGLTTLIQQLYKCFNAQYDKCDVFVHNGVSQSKIEIVENDIINKFNYYDEYTELIDIINTYDCMINISCIFNNKFEQKFFDFLCNIHIIKGLFLPRRSRMIKTFAKELISDRIVNKYDFLCTFAKENSNIYNFLKTKNNNVFSYDFNFYDYANGNFKNLELSKRENVITYCGRFVQFKGFNKIVNDAQKLIQDEYIIVAQGGEYRQAKDGRIAGSFTIMCQLCNLPDKTIRDNINVHYDYEEYNVEQLSRKFVHLFPSYNKISKNKRLAKSLFSLFPYGYKQKYFKEQCWSQGLEYTALESIVCGCPIITTKEYGKALLIKGKPLIEYDCGIIFIDDFADIFPAIKEYSKNYNRNVEKMQKFFYKNYNNIDRIQKFENIIKEIKQEKGC